MGGGLEKFAGGLSPGGWNNGAQGSGSRSSDGVLWSSLHGNPDSRRTDEQDGTAMESDRTAGFQWYAGFNRKCSRCGEADGL